MGYHLEGKLLEVCDCKVLCPCWIGEAPRQEMERLGFAVYAITGPIEPALAELGRVL